jgi:hypothetical protein
MNTIPITFMILRLQPIGRIGPIHTIIRIIIGTVIHCHNGKQLLQSLLYDWITDIRYRCCGIGIGIGAGIVAHNDVHVFIYNPLYCHFIGLLYYLVIVITISAQGFVR